MRELDIIYEDSKLLVINKMSGPITERNPFESNTVEDLVYRYLGTLRKKPYVGVVHRLDRVTSGVLLFAKNKSTLVALNQAFEKRQVQKTYLAITSNPPAKSTGTLNHELIIDRKQKKALISPHKSPQTTSATLNYRIRHSDEHATYIEVHPKTGRFHQIRTQLAHIGCPIIGDTLYGGTPTSYERQICLHAEHLKLHPTIGDIPLEFTAPIPQEGIWSKYSELSKLG